MEALRLRRKKENEKIYNFRGFEPLVKSKNYGSGDDNTALENFL